MKIISRKDAKSLNLKKYFTGKLCKHGHISERIASNGGCLECSRKYNANHKERIAEYQKEYSANHKEEMAEYRANHKEEKAKYQKEYDANHKRDRAEYRANHKEERGEYYKEYSANHKEEKREYDKEYRKTNSGKFAAKEAKRRSAKLQRTPLWADLNIIKEIYEKCPEGYHVDHIVPLQGKLVSGLHIAENLQYLTAKENLEKQNKFKIL